MNFYEKSIQLWNSFCQSFLVIGHLISLFSCVCQSQRWIYVNYQFIRLFRTHLHRQQIHLFIFFEIYWIFRIFAFINYFYSNFDTCLDNSLRSWVNLNCIYLKKACNCIERYQKRACTINNTSIGQDIDECFFSGISRWFKVLVKKITDKYVRGWNASNVSYHGM